MCCTRLRADFATISKYSVLGIAGALNHSTNICSIEIHLSIMNEPVMNVLVCVKQIPDPNVPGKLDPQTKRLVREGVDLVLDPGDEHGVEAGLQLVEKDGGEVTVISMGPPKAMDAIRRALAMGAHRGILVTDPGLENSDAISTARAIAAAIK